jgi:hypothetical protein
MIVDALFALAKKSGRLQVPKNLPHAERINLMCTAFGIPTDPDMVAKIVDIRNDLLHEVLWEQRMPGSTVSHFAYATTHFLSSISKRAGLVLLGVGGRYVQTAWWRMVVDILHVA